MSRSINKVMLLGNLTKDPLTRTDSSGNNYLLFTIATNRNWRDKAGQEKEETEFHRIIAWDKLGEICGKFLSKGKKIYMEGRMNTRESTSEDGKERLITEIVATDVIFLDKREGVIHNGSDTNANR